MICPECNGKGEVKYYREVDRDENSVTVEGHLDICHTCHGSGIKVQSNADHIRSMTDEEMHKFLCSKMGCNWCDWASSRGCLMEEWLKQPYKGDA